MPEYDVVVVGSIIVDMTAFTDVVPVFNETLLGKAFNLGYGGKGANQCVMAQNLGANVALVGAVGDDTFGRDYLNYMTNEGINVQHVEKLKNCSTGVAQITVMTEGVDKGKNAIIVIPGASMLFSAEHLQKSLNLLENCKVLVGQLEMNLSVMMCLMKAATKHTNLVSILNTAPLQNSFDLTIIQEMIKLPDIVCANEVEASVLTKMPCVSIEEAFKCLECLKIQGCKFPIITLGENGAVLYDDKNAPLHLPAAKVDNVVDTTGAGDCFVGSLAYFIALYPSLSRQEAVRRSICIASISVTKVGTQKSYPRKNNIHDCSLFT